jgi:hypothetical protein
MQPAVVVAADLLLAGSGGSDGQPDATTADGSRQS